MSNPYLLALEIIIILIYPFVVTYINQRVKNKADIQVLKKLTTIEDGIKTANAIQLDRSKQIFSEEKDSIIVFFAQLNTWLWESLIIDYNQYNEENFEQIQIKLIEIRKAFNKSMVEYSKVIIIIDDSDLVQKGRDAINKIFDLQTIQEPALNKLYVNLRISSLLYNELIKTQSNTSEPYDNSQFSRNQEMYNQKRADLTELKTNHNIFDKDVFSSAIKAVDTFKDLARDYIRK